jgi:hypothetical protein
MKKETMAERFAALNAIVREIQSIVDFEEPNAALTEEKFRAMSTKEKKEEAAKLLSEIRSELADFERDLLRYQEGK